MRGVANKTLQETCVRLRIDQRMSLREIQQSTGAPKGSLSTWLKAYPLTPAEKAQRIQEGSRKPRGTRKDRGEESWLHQLAVQGLTPAEKGRVAETAVLLRMVLNKFRVFGAKFEGEKADWVVEVPETGRIWKVQVKSTSRTKVGLPVVLLTCSEGHSHRRRYRAGEFDFLVGYDLFTDTAYVWSWAELETQKCTVTIVPEAAEAWGKLRTCLLAG